MEIEAMSYALLRRKAETAPAPKTTAAASGLRLGDPNDTFEREADRVADEVVVGGPLVRPTWSLSAMDTSPPLQRKCACGGSGECRECKEKKTLQRKVHGPAQTGNAPPIIHEVLRSPGKALE